MKFSSFIICLSLIYHASLAQTKQERVHINGGAELWPNFVKEMFLYPSFKDGVVTYKNGQVFNRAMNYNKVLETIQFIDEHNDTLAIADEAAVKTIKIEDDIFIYQPACVQVLLAGENINLYKHEKVRVADIRRKGLYGIPNSSAAIESLNQVYTWMSSYQLDINELILLSKTTDFYILANDDQLIPASKKNILKSYPQKQKEINAFITSENMSFSSEENLVELARFIEQLPRS